MEEAKKSSEMETGMETKKSGSEQYTELLEKAEDTQLAVYRLLQQTLELRMKASVMQMEYAALYGMLDHALRDEHSDQQIDKP